MYSPHGTDFTFSALSLRTNFIRSGQSRGQQAIGRADSPLNPPRDGQSRWSAVADYGMVAYISRTLSP